jgi:RHS repeat-associated protein
VSPYTYNSSNELTSIPSGSYTYDNNGNTKTKPDGTQYTWDLENRLVQVVLPGTGGTVHFKYDPFGRRIQKSGPLGTTNYLYDGLDLIEELDTSGNVLARYSQGPGLDQPLSMLRAGTTAYYQQDGLASITSLSNSASALANTYSYDSFGKLTASTGTLTNPFQFTGREFDQETGIYEYRTRYYDQNIGRFANEDTIHFRGGLNFYAYALNRPTQFVDPTGKVSIAPGFSPQCLADILSALQLLKNRPPACDCWFRSHGLNLSLAQMLANPAFTINYDPNHDYSEGGATLGYVWRTPFDIYITVDGCNSGPNHIAQDLVHELAHLTLGQFNLQHQLSPFEHNKVRNVEQLCGFTIQGPVTTITVTP